MAQNGVPTEYRILMRRVLETSGDLSAPQFTVIVAAARPDDAISEAERLTDILQGQFSVVEIHPARAPEEDSRDWVIPD